MANEPQPKLVHEQQQERSRRTHRAILKATEELMNVRPFDQISIAEIAKTAGISVGNFYNRFPDKTALLLTMFDDYERERTEYLTEAFDLKHWKGKSLEERAEGVVALFIDFFWSRRALIRSFVVHHRADPEAIPLSIGKRPRNIYNIYKAGAMVLADATEGDGAAEKRAQLGLQTVTALCREFILFSNDPTKKALGLSRKALQAHLTRMLLASMEAED